MVSFPHEKDTVRVCFVTTAWNDWAVGRRVCTGLLVPLLLGVLEDLHAVVPVVLAECVHLGEHLLCRLPGGESPPDVLYFVVDMIHLDQEHLCCLISTRYDLRKTLFYYLFSNLQVYETIFDIQHVFSLINDGVVPLNGGILKPNGSFFLCNIIIN